MEAPEAKEKKGAEMLLEEEKADTASLLTEMPPLIIAAGLLEKEEQELAKLHEQRAGLMDDLLTGRVRVNPLLALDTPPTGPKR